MEVTLKTEVEAGASGFSVKGGGNEGLFIKKVLKESPASKIFSLREGDQLLSATIFFDNIKYEDALKILQYSEPYRVQFSLKRKIAVQEDVEHSSAQHKKERMGQEKELSEGIPEEALHDSGKAISEEDQETLIVSQRVGRSKRTKKDRLSWPKFQSIRNKKILRHGRSHSTSDAYEPAIQDISPTSTDTESQFPQEVHTKEKKGSQRKLKFPSIGFRMHRSKPEPQEKQKKEIKTTLISEREKTYEDDTSLENPEILTVEYTTYPAYEMKIGEVHETLTKDLKDMKNGIPSHVKQRPEVEISIKKEKDKEPTSKFSVPEVPDITTETPKPSLETADLKVSPTKKSPQASSKSRRKKQKGATDKKERESGINIDLIGHTAKGSVQVKGLEIGTAKAELQTSDLLETGQKQAEEDTQMLNIQKINYGISLPKRKETDTDTTKQGSEKPQSVPEKAADMTSEDSKNFDVKTHMPDAESEGSTWRIQLPSFKMAKTPKTDMKITRDESREDTEDSVKKERIEEDGILTNDKALTIDMGMKTGEKDIEGKESKFRLPKLKFPTFTWSTAKEEIGQSETQISAREGKVGNLDKEGEIEECEQAGEIKMPSAEIQIGITKGKINENDIKQKPKVQLPSPKKLTIKPPSTEMNIEETQGKSMISKTDIKIEKSEFTKKSNEKEEISLIKGLDIKAPKVDISLPSVDVTLPQASVDVQAPEVALSLEGEAKGPEKEAAKTKDGKFKMPKFGMPSFGWSSSREAKGTVAADVDVSLKEPQVTVPLAAAELDVTLPESEIHVPTFDVPLDSSLAKEDEMGKSKSSVFRMPKISLSKSFKPHAQIQSGVEVSGSDAHCYSLTEETSSVPSEIVESKPLHDIKGDTVSKSSKFRVPSIGFSKAEGSSSKIDLDSSLQTGDITLTKYQINVTESQSKLASLADENLSDFEILSEDGCEEQGGLKLEGKTTSAEVSLVDTEVTVKIPKFRKPKFRIRSKGKASESDIGSNVESEISKRKIIADMTDPDTEKPAQISDAQLDVKLQKPSLSVVLDAPTLDTNLSPTEITLPKLEAEIHGPDLECKAEQEVFSGEKVSEEKESKFKSSKFKLPSFRWSPKKEPIAPSHVEEHLEGPTLSTLSGDTGSELPFSTPENQYPHVEFDTTEKDGEKVKTKKSQFTMPKISFPKIKGQKVQVSLPVLDTDVSGPKQEKEGVSVEKSEKGSSGQGAGLDIKVPKVTVPTLEFSKTEAKAPKIEMDISMPTGEVILPTCEEGELTLKSAAANASLSTSDTKMIMEDSLEVKSPDKSVERASSEVAVGDVEIKVEGSEGKTKMPKFQMPNVGITLSKGKGSEKDVGQSKSEVKVPQLKATVEISDIAVEAPNLEVECGTGTETYSPEVKMTKIDSKASEADVHFPSADISIPKPDSDIQDSDAAVKIKREIKQDGDGEEKEGHFKMPKFKLPSFSWSPKKEASVKSDSGANLEDQNLDVMSSRIDTEVKGTATDEQDSGPDLDLEISAGKVEQKSPIKKPQFVMPKISLSKIKVPKSQSHSQKVEADATLLKTGIEADDSIMIPDIEKCHSEGTEEGAQISIKLADTKVHSLKFSRIETETSKTEMTISSEKTDASLTPSDGSFQQVDFKIISTNECHIQKTGIKLPKGEASVDLKSPDILTESSSVVDGKKVKLEGPEGKIKMPKFQKPKFGISLTKGKGPETEISSPKIEAELPQLKTTNEIADIAVGVPALELKSDMSDPGEIDGKIKTPQALMGGIEAAQVDISTLSVSKPKTEGVTESLEEKEIKLKEHEIKAEEVQTEEYQGWFKMPKFRIPGFGRSSSKEKRSNADIERSMEKAQATTPSAKVQTETSIPENTFSLPHAVAEITIGKEGIKKLGDSVKSSDVSVPKMEGDISLSTERPASKVNIPKTETYADVVKRSAEGHTSEITMSAAELSKSYPSASETDKDSSSANRFSTCTLTFPEHKVKSRDTEVPKVESSMKLETSGVRCKPLSAEITLDATQKKIDVSLPKEELDIQNKEAAIKTGKIKGEVKLIGKDSEESQLKRTTCEWSTTKGSEEGTYVTAKLEDLKVDVPTVKTDVKITTIDPEIKFQVKNVEKDVSAGVEVQVEDRAETSKIKAYKFKIPKFGMLHSEIKGFEGDTDLPKSEVDSASKSEIGTAEMQLQKPEGLIGLKSPALDHMEASARITGEIVDLTQGVPEVTVRIPKLKIPRFTVRTLPIEADVLLSKVVTDPKGSSTDIEVVQLQASSILEETPGALEGGIQKAKSKILTLTEPDVKTAKMTATIESSPSSAGQDIHWSYIEGQEISEKVEPEHVSIERCEIYTTEIVKESEILSSEVKTATLGFSLLKTKLPESRSDLEVLAQQPSPTGGASARKPKGAGESFDVGEDVVEDVVEMVEGEEKDITNEREKTDSKRSPGRFKFWLPSIGFSSSGDETSTEAKPEIKKSVPEDVKPADISDDSSKQAEKTGWFRFPKLGFTSPSKKAKSVDKEEVGHKEGRFSDEESPTDKPDVFFDAQESLSPREITDGEKAEIDGASSIVTSSARTELILLEEEKDSKSNIVGDTTK